jgi:NAD(P)-dependent dehydrogenase (short-subunit alcohol dehydrogenase family)
MTINGKTVLVTGASRGIGQALVEDALRRGATRVYAAARHPLAHPDERVTPLAVDVSDAAQVQHTAAGVGSLDLLINNAGVQPLDDLSGTVALEEALAVNLFGTYRVSQALLPALIRSGGTIVNNVSLAAIAPVPFAPAYSISKAAELSLTQALRMLLARHGVTVHSVLTGPVDTEMTRGLEIPKSSGLLALIMRDPPDPIDQPYRSGFRCSRWAVVAAVRTTDLRVGKDLAGMSGGSDGVGPRRRAFPAALGGECEHPGAAQCGVRAKRRRVDRRGGSHLPRPARGAGDQRSQVRW